MAIKSGFKSSEFWVSIAAMVLPYVVSALQSAPNPWVAGAGAVVAAVYTYVRHNLKLDAQQAAALPAELPQAPASGVDPVHGNN